jgi:23S rRNA (guanine2535-N1)-methyltransferase
LAYRYAKVSSPLDRHLASGVVIRSIPGRPALPVRLIRELAAATRTLWDRTAGGRCPVLWDPCCGLGHLVTCVSLLHDVSVSVASDVDGGAVQVAVRNLALLRDDGLSARGEEVRVHRPHALDSVAAVASLLRGVPPVTRTFVADATDPAQCRSGLGDCLPDIVLTDVPYGEQTDWDGDRQVADLLASLHLTAAPRAVLGLVTPNRLRMPDSPWQRAGTWNIGRRRIWLLRAMD